MITFGEITSKNLRADYTKEDIEGYKVVGSVNYNRDDRVTDADGTIYDVEEKRVANFNVYGEGEYAKVNLTDCIAGRMGEAVEVAEATLADLAASYPEK